MPKLTLKGGGVIDLAIDVTHCSLHNSVQTDAEMHPAIAMMALPDAKSAFQTPLIMTSNEACALANLLYDMAHALEFRSTHVSLVNTALPKQETEMPQDLQPKGNADGEMAEAATTDGRRTGTHKTLSTEPQEAARFGIGQTRGNDTGPADGARRAEQAVSTGQADSGQSDAMASGGRADRPRDGVGMADQMDGWRTGDVTSLHPRAERLLTDANVPFGWDVADTSTEEDVK